LHYVLQNCKKRFENPNVVVIILYMLLIFIRLLQK